MKIKFTSIITCPECGFEKIEMMPSNSCQWFYECENCKAIIKPKSGNCCVYCSYGSVECPSMQRDKVCCEK